MGKTLVIVLGETRASELTFDNFKKNVLDELEADLCVCIGVKNDYDYSNPFYSAAKYRFEYAEPEDYADAFDYAYSVISKDRSKYECLQHMNGLYGKLKHPKEKRENITYRGSSDGVDFEEWNDDEIVVHRKTFGNELWRDSVFGMTQNKEKNYVPERDVDTYVKPLPWREFLKVKDQFLGGIKDKDNQHPGSAGILIFFRWFLLENIKKHGLLDEYAHFVITRSDFVYQMPHPKVERMDDSKIWIPDGEHYNGYTDRHVVLSPQHVEPYLNILNHFVLKSNEYFIQMMHTPDWNLEKLIKFHLSQHNLIPAVREFPYVMYSVRNINGTTRWKVGDFSPELGYYIKYQTEFERSTLYKELGVSADELYDRYYQK